MLDKGYHQMVDIEVKEEVNLQDRISQKINSQRYILPCLLDILEYWHALVCEVSDIG